MVCWWKLNKIKKKRRMGEVQTLIGTLDPNMHAIRFHIGRIQDDFHHVDFKLVRTSEADHL